MSIVTEWLNKYKLSSLKAKVLFMMGAMLTIFTLIAVVQVYFLYNEQKRNIGSNVEGYVLNLASGIGQKFEQNYFAVQNFALNRVFESNNLEQIENALNTYALSNSAYDLIVFVSTDGRYVASNTSTLNGNEINTNFLRTVDYSSLPWFKNSLNGLYTNDEDLGRVGTYLEDAHFDPLTTKALGADRYGVSFTTAVKSASGQTIGVLSLRTNFSWVTDRITSMYDTLQTKNVKKAEFYLFGKDGRVLFHYDPYYANTTTVKFDKSELGLRNIQSEGVTGVAEALSLDTGYRMGVPSFDGRDRSYLGYASLAFDTVRQFSWGMILNIEESELTGALSAQTNIFYSLVVFFCCVFLLIAWKMTTVESDRLVHETNNLKQRSASSISTSGNLNKVSSELSDAARLQQEAVQETMAALDQMMSMLSNTNKYVEESLQSADGVNQKTQDGSHIMNRMEESMGSIQNSNSDLESMAKIIEAISEKTNVINEIVFNTKLLAFNASIEAARAGVHGKGFAVVAEEVGNLAQLSGEAAKDSEGGSLETVR